MAAVAAPMYNSHNHFTSSSSRSATTTLINSAHQSQIDQDDDQFTTLFCRALYDYEAQDASALSFRQNDIIEVLTQQPSGWWDGLLGDERGWFPSNYVTVISDEEAELAFSSSEQSNLSNSANDFGADNASVLDMSHAMMRGSQAENEEWLDAEIDGLQGGLEGLANEALSRPPESSDFWMPDMTSDGQIYYVNTRTGQHARDLPNEGDGDTSDSDLAGLTSQSSSRSGTSAGRGLSNGLPQGPRETGSSAGFGLLRRTGTPEPWVKKLADDGMSYYYYNTSDGAVQWTRPEPTHTRDRSLPSTNRPAPSTNSKSTPTIRPLPPTTSRTPPKASRLSVYSDSSDIQPSDSDRPARQKQNGFHRPPREPIVDVKMELTSAERIAQSLQLALAPAPAELVTDLSAVARSAIQAVIENIDAAGLGRRAPGDDRQMDALVSGVVFAVRNLLYVSAASTGQIPTNVLPRSMRNNQPPFISSPLKPAQRKVTATLSRLVLSARALQYDAGSTVTDTLDRIQVDAEELERAVLSFVLEVQRVQHAASADVRSLKRLHGVFMTANIGLGLVGAGAAASWKGFGWVSLGDEDAPREILGTEVVNQLSSYAHELDHSFATLQQVARDDNSVESVRGHTRSLITQLSSFLRFASNVHVARHVDIDGIRQDTGPGPNEMYAQTVDKARALIRTLEHALQSLYDESISILLTAQSLRQVEPGQSLQPRDMSIDYLHTLCASLKANLEVVTQTFEALLSIGHEQADVANGDYNGSIDWRMSRLSVIGAQFGGSLRPMSTFDEHGDMIDMEVALGRKGHIPVDSFDSMRYQSNENTAFNDEPEPSVDDTMVSHDSSSIKGGEFLDDASPTMDEEFSSRPKRRGKKLEDILGKEYASQAPKAPEPELPPKPWYLQPSYSPTEFVIEGDGTVRAGTVPALVERLTAHEQGDPTFIKSFLMTFKSFTTVDDLFDLLVQRFWIQPPPKLSPSEREEWGKLKQHVIQIRVLNTFKSMVVDDDVLEKDDLFILDRMKEFITTEEVSKFPAAKQLLNLIERAQKGGDSMIKMVTAAQGVPPAPIVPKSSKKLKLLDIDPLELARQLTIMESQLYQRIRPMECLQRAREARTENIDNITVVIQTSNKIALWVAESVLSKEDSRRRASAVKHLISVADRCRLLNNFSTMAAITAGLNTPPIRRLKRTWEQVNQRYMAMFGACEMTIDSNKNFIKYRSMMTSVIPPCVPFIGVFLSTLQFIQDGNKDNIPAPGAKDGSGATLVNFWKRQKASEVINDIKRWQVSFNLHVIPSVQAYIEESLNSVSDTKESSERFWLTSLEREPREREDEKMARLLQESGFL
ncbi:ras guanine nucleotide exchange factor domain-containing protein [Mycena metata]|uniref:Ras guanine nucleotide exchange factor domain-containing protein n=1 Tax=Mycena metata TaxID=1033252 RepID=A0AAD7H625_9AGAR|nr:ras guanine nucleotide exchange factor domain-containing protein [Mycena metata]